MHAAKNLPKGSVIALHGPLGAGKTSFVQGLAAGLGIAQDIPSPTFTYLNLYEKQGLFLAHFDLYRMKSPSDFFAMGFEEYLEGDGIAAIEWPERLGDSLPKGAIALSFEYTPRGRTVYLASDFAPDLIDFLATWD